MSSSVRVSLPDEMQAYVQRRTSGQAGFATASEYVRELIRRDMDSERERTIVFAELVKSIQEIERGELISADQLDSELDDLFAGWKKDDTEGQ